MPTVLRLDRLPAGRRRHAASTALTCEIRLACEQGIWKALLPERAARYSRFVEDYESIRAAEGRGSTTATTTTLRFPIAIFPAVLVGSGHSARARFAISSGKILPRITTLAHNRLRILDLGAGNGWMSYRLASQGHAPVAVDLLTNDQDGLGAARHYKQRLTSLFPRFQAELDNLPFARWPIRPGDLQFFVPLFRELRKDTRGSASLCSQRTARC